MIVTSLQSLITQFFLFRVPSIGSSSIYHDASLISESRIFAMPDTNLERGSSSGQPLASTGPISHINAQNRAKVVSHLFSVFAFLLGSVSKDCLDWTCRVSSRMITRYKVYVIRLSHFHHSEGSTRTRRNSLVISRRITEFQAMDQNLEWEGWEAVNLKFPGYLFLTLFTWTC